MRDHSTISFRRPRSAASGHLHWSAEFSNSALERAFLSHDAPRCAWQLSWIGAASVVVFLSFSFLDYELFGLNSLFAKLLVLRVATATTLLTLAWAAFRDTTGMRLSGMAVAVEGLFVASLLIVATVYPASYLFTVEEGLIVAVFTIFLGVPGRWILSCAVALSGSAGLLAIETIRFHGLTRAWYPFATLLVLSNVIGAITSHHLHALHRLQFLAMRDASRANARLKVAADTDSLTNLLNHQSFFVAATQRLAAAHQQHRPCSVLFLDVDHFKAVNDQLGHLAGDQWLKEIASICCATLRKGDIIGRVGGEEFAAFLEGADEQQAGVLAERLRASIERARMSGSALNRLTATIGVSVCRADETGVGPAVHRADAAMYHGKKSGRNRVVAAHGFAEPVLATAAAIPAGRSTPSPRGGQHVPTP